MRSSNTRKEFKLLCRDELINADCDKMFKLFISICKNYYFYIKLHIFDDVIKKLIKPCEIDGPSNTRKKLKLLCRDELVDADCDKIFKVYI